MRPISSKRHVGEEGFTTGLWNGCAKPVTGTHPEGTRCVDDFTWKCEYHTCTKAINILTKMEGEI